MMGYWVDEKNLSLSEHYTNIGLLLPTNLNFIGITGFYLFLL